MQHGKELKTYHSGILARAVLRGVFQGWYRQESHVDTKPFSRHAPPRACGASVMNYQMILSILYLTCRLRFIIPTSLDQHRRSMLGYFGFLHFGPRFSFLFPLVSKCKHPTCLCFSVRVSRLPHDQGVHQVCPAFRDFWFQMALLRPPSIIQCLTLTYMRHLLFPSLLLNQLFSYGKSWLHMIHIRSISILSYM